MPQQDPYASVATQQDDPYASIASPQQMLRENVGKLREQNKKPLPEVKADQTIPQFLQQYFTERGEANQAAAQALVNRGFGPEAEGHNALSRSLSNELSIIPETAAVLDKIAAGVMDPKTAIAMVGSKITPSLAAGYFLYQGLKGTAESTKGGKVASLWPNPDNVQNFLLGLSTAAGAGAGLRAEAPKAIAKAADVVHKGAQHLAGAGPEQTTAPIAEKFKVKADEATAKNEARAKIEKIKDEGKKAMAQGSMELGESIKSVNEALRVEGGENYAAVRQATANDPGAPLVELSQAARHAETNILKGSAENIKQFRELIRKAPEAEGIQTSAGFAAPGDPLYDALIEQGAIDTGGTLPFDQLQGYSSEIGAKLSSGGLAGDVYQALKYVKDKIDAQKTAIAERNGVGPQLKEADAFWSAYQRVFYDKPSAVAATLSRVGKLDPQHYAEPFTKGKAAETGIQALRDIKTKNPATRSYLDSIANRADALRQQTDAQGRLPKTPQAAEQPKAPTVEEVRKAKEAEIRSRSAQWRGLNRYEIGFLLGSPIATFIKGGLKSAVVNLAADIGYIAGKQAAASLVVKPKVIEWLSKPRPEDIAILEKLPKDEQNAIRSGLKRFIANENRVGTAEGAASDTELFQKARRELGQQASLSAVSKRAQELKQQNAVPGTALGTKAKLSIHPSVAGFLAGAGQRKTPAQMKKELEDLRDREKKQTSSNPFVP